MKWKNILVGAFVLALIFLPFKWWLMDWFAKPVPVRMYIIDAVTIYLIFVLAEVLNKYFEKRKKKH